MRVAVVQSDPLIGAVSHNIEAIAEVAGNAAGEGAQLLVFPECALTGYMFSSLEEGMEVAEPVPGPSTLELIDIARERQIYLVAGLLERLGPRFFNAAVLIGPKGHIATYRKTHTLCLGVDRFVSPGDQPYAVHDLPIGRIGILICYDLRFPEAARTLGLAGVQVIAVPTNWPDSSSIMPEVFARCRAAENRVFLAAADRVGEERDAKFLGRSLIVSPDGTVMAEAGSIEPEMLLADLDLRQADRKHVVLVPGEHESDIARDRRPDLYDRAVVRGTVSSSV